MNSDIIFVLNTLTNAGFSAYVVGGYVRDYLLLLSSFDVDICTNASVSNMHDLFKFGIGNSFGTYIYNYGDYSFEMTTYRIESNYISRKPTDITFTDNLLLDLPRRDFTINSICMNQDGEFFDYFSGIDDISNKLIVCIGDNDKKMVDDPLRMLRAIRFATVLDFKIDSLLYDSIKKNFYLIKNLSTFRVMQELDKMLVSSNFLYGFNLLNDFDFFTMFNMNNNNIVFYDNINIMYLQLGIDFSFLKKNNVKIIKKIQKIINYGKIDSTVLFEYGLSFCISICEYFNLSKDDIYVMYNNMGVNDDKPLCIDFLNILSILNINDKLLGKSVQMDVIHLILTNNLKNIKSDVINYLLERKEKLCTVEIKDLL